MAGTFHSLMDGFVIAFQWSNLGYALLGCTVGPGFEYEDFSLLEDDPMALRLLQRLDPQLAVLA